jgi:hypothetical protein
MISKSRIYPRNLTARAYHQIDGNPDTTRPEDSNANCYPGLDLDLRNLDRRFFPGLVFNFVARRDISAPYIEPQRYGGLLSYLDTFGDPDLQPEFASNLDGEIQLLAAALFTAFRGDIGVLLADGDWYLDWVEQCGKRIRMSRRETDGSDKPLDGLFVWRLVRSLEPGKVTICLVRRSGTRRRIRLEGWRRSYTDSITGVISEAYQPGELTQSLCSPWQHDFRDCSCHYWASNRPDVVFTPLNGVLTDWMRANRSPAQTARAHSRVARNRPYQMEHYQINSTWQNLNMVLENTEIGADYVAPTAAGQTARPYRSPLELAEALRCSLAPLELTLALEYLYARFSLLSPEEATARGSIPLRDHVTIARHYLLLIAASEMQHVRWANEILWSLFESGLITEYNPVLTLAQTVPRGPQNPPRHRALRPLERETLEDFIAVEQPSGTIDGAYAKVIVTLAGQEYQKLPHLRDTASRIANDGVQHYERLCELQRVLKHYDGDPSYPYLRKITLGTAASAAVAIARRDAILKELHDAYVGLARGSFAAVANLISGARQNMALLIEEGERLAAQGVGIPFWEDPSPSDK